jgi:hypothetical protein
MQLDVSDTINISMKILSIITEDQDYARGTSADVPLAGLDISADKWAKIIPGGRLPRRIYFNDAYHMQDRVLGMTAGGDLVETNLRWAENYVDGSETWQDIYDVEQLDTAQMVYAERATLAAWHEGIWPLVQEKFPEAQLLKLVLHWQYDMVEATIRYNRPD